MIRLLIFVRRFFKARHLGFTFKGQTHTDPPTEISTPIGRLSIHYSNEIDVFNDVVDLWLDDEYGVKHINGPVNRIVDVGANIGLFSIHAKVHYPCAILHAYEPNPRLSKTLEENLAQFSRITIFNEGVASASTKANFLEQNTSRLGRTEITADGAIDLAGIETVIDRIEGQIDLLKLDCEGAEWDILLNTSAFRHVKNIRMEYHKVGSDDPVAKLKSFAAEAGFQLTRLRQNNGFGIAWLRNSDLLP